MKRRSKAALVLGSAILCGLGLLLCFMPDARRPLAAIPSDSPRNPAEPLHALDPELDPAGSQVIARVAASPTNETVAVPSPEPTASLIGSVIGGVALDLLATPVPGVSVRYQPDAPGTSSPSTSVVSDANGRFQIGIDNPAGVLRAGPGAWVAVFEPRVSVTEPRIQRLLVVTPIQELHGQVVDDSRKGVSDASLEIELPKVWGFPEDDEWRHFGPDNAIRSTFPLNLDGCNTAQWKCKSDANGGFAIPDAPRVSKAQLVTRHDGFEVDKRELPRTLESTTIVLHRPKKEVGHLRGKVLGPRRESIRSATVCLGSKRTSTDRWGWFDFDLEDHPECDQIVAFDGRWMPVSQARLGASALDPNAWPSPLTLTFRDEALTIRGRVVNERGEPFSDCRVRVLDPVTTDEVLSLTGAPLFKDRGGADVVGDREVSCDQDGAFVLHGLLPRSYRLRAREMHTLDSVDTEPIEAGRSDVVIPIAAVNSYRCVAGKLTYADGSLATNLRIQAKQTEASGDIDSTEIRTDAEGRFHFDGLSKVADFLEVSLEGVPGRRFRLADYPDSCSLVFVVPRTGDIRLEVGGEAAAADEFAVLDAHGTRLEMGMRWGAEPQWENQSIAIRDGKSEWVIAPDDAVTVVLLKGGREVMRAPLQVRPGQLTLVRP